jgi:hypothetical protein
VTNKMLAQAQQLPALRHLALPAPACHAPRFNACTAQVSEQRNLSCAKDSCVDLSLYAMVYLPSCLGILHAKGDTE